MAVQCVYLLVCCGHLGDRYALEVQKENKFLRLERMIVYLIMAELAVSLIHTPAGDAVFEGLKWFQNFIFP